MCTFCGKKKIFHMRPISIEMGDISMNAICVGLALVLISTGTNNSLKRRNQVSWKNTILNYSQSSHKYLFLAIREIRLKNLVGLSAFHLQKPKNSVCMYQQPLNQVHHLLIYR